MTSELSGMPDVHLLGYTTPRSRDSAVYVDLEQRRVVALLPDLRHKPVEVEVDVEVFGIGRLKIPAGEGSSGEVPPCLLEAPPCWVRGRVLSDAAPEDIAVIGDCHLWAGVRADRTFSIGVIAPPCKLKALLLPEANSAAFDTVAACDATVTLTIP